jgi:hypothetical protein
MPLRIPVLAYHAMHVSGNSYEDNDHVAFARDLEIIAGLGLRVCPLTEIVSAVERDDLGAVAGCVGITFDDGSDFDFRDLPHPSWGDQRSIFSILWGASRTGRHPTLEATSFTIVSPEARRELDVKCMIGMQWWNDDWWAVADASGLLRIESHSWDHNHECLTASRATASRGTFKLANDAEANAQIRDANAYLCDRRGRHGAVLLAYPYGDASDYITREYMPQGMNVHGIRAAFTTEGKPISRGADRWQLPRYVFRSHWKSEGDLERILRECRPGALAKLGRRMRPVSRESAPAIQFEELTTPDADVAALFQHAFKSPPPDYPRHFIASYRTENRRIICGYVHHLQLEDGLFLVGGLCVDPSFYRRVAPDTRTEIRQHGSLSRWLLAASIGLLGPKRAVFAYTGNTMSRRDCHALGFDSASGEYLMAQWHNEPAERRASVIARVAQLGPF